jgi:hypothetical protein
MTKPIDHAGKNAAVKWSDHAGIPALGLTG